MSDGFIWGPMKVEKFIQVTRPGRGVYRAIRIVTDGSSKPLDIYVSPTGKRVRPFRGGKELK